MTVTMDVEGKGGMIITCINVQGQKLLKKESDVGMLLTGKQSTETSCM